MAENIDNTENGGPQIDHDEVARRAPDIASRYQALTERIAELGGTNVEVLSVSKGHPVEAALAARSVGLVTLGENYAQDLAAKAQIMSGDNEATVEWHFIGQMQTNKVRLIAAHVAVWQSVDRLKVGTEIAKRAPGATVFVQANLADDPNKAGCALGDIDLLVEQLREKGLHVAGLMGVGTDGDQIATARGFANLRSSVDRLGLVHCSMGMSADLEIAIREGSTMVRIGSEIFGPRPT